MTTKLTTREVVLSAMQNHMDYCERHPHRPIALDGKVPTDEAKETAAMLDEIERRANSLRIERYRQIGHISSEGAW